MSASAASRHMTLYVHVTKISNHFISKNMWTLVTRSACRHTNGFDYVTIGASVFRVGDNVLPLTRFIVAELHNSVFIRLLGFYFARANFPQFDCRTRNTEILDTATSDTSTLDLDLKMMVDGGCQKED